MNAPTVNSPAPAPAPGAVIAAAAGLRVVQLGHVLQSGQTRNGTAPPYSHAMTNGFGELTDAAEQRRRFAAEMDEKARIYGERYPIDEDFLAALSHMPPASGVAMGFDRLVMLATGATEIDQVLWVPVHSPPASAN